MSENTPDESDREGGEPHPMQEHYDYNPDGCSDSCEICLAYTNGADDYEGAVYACLMELREEHKFIFIPTEGEPVVVEPPEGERLEWLQDFVGGFIEVIPGCRGQNLMWLQDLFLLDGFPKKGWSKSSLGDFFPSPPICDIAYVNEEGGPMLKALPINEEASVIFNQLLFGPVIMEVYFNV